MNKYLLNLSVVLLLVLAVSSVNAQTRTATASGNWNNTATWGGASVPTSAMDVVINSGVTVNVTAGAQCATLSFLSSATANTTVSISTGITLDVSGAVTIPRAASNVNRIAVGAGTLNAGSIAFTNGGGNVRHEITISTGTVNVSGNVTQVGSTGSASFTFTGAGLLQLGGTFLNSGNGTLTPSTGTVEYDAAGAQSIGDFDYNNLKLSGSGAKTTIGTTTAVGVTVSAGSNFTLAGFNFTATGTTSIDGTLTVSSTTGTKIFDNLVINNGGLFNSTVNENYTMNGNLQVDGTGSINSGTGTWAFATAAVFSGTGAATITDVDINGTATNNGTYTFTNLDIDGTGTFTFTNNGTINAAAITGTGNDTYSQGAGSVLNFSGATLAISNISVAGAGNTVNYNGGTQTVRALSYQNLVLSGTNAKTVTGSTINVKLSMQGTATATGTSPTYAAAAILEYKGSGAQNTSNVEFVGTGANPTNLTIDNTNGVTLNVGKSINGALTLANGYLTTTNTNLLTINTVGSASTSNGAFVNGPLSKVKNTTALFTFPVGTLAGGLRTIGVTPTTTTSTTYRATFNTGNPKTSVGNNLGTLAEISNCEYWDLTQTSGTTPAKVTLSWPAAANSCGQAYVGNVASLVVGHFSGGAWSNEGQSAFSGTPSAGGTVTSANNLSSFSPFVLATTNASENPLPVMFADVKAFQKNSGVEVSWSNLTERDLISYTVERSSNGQTFTSVNQVAPRSNANDKESYSAFDASPIAGVNYYRVKVLEVSGKIIYSKVLKVDLSGKQTGISLYPNPVSGNQVSLSINVKQGQYTVKVLNGAGQQVYSQRLIHQGGSMTQTVELPSSVKPGVYNMMVTGDNYRESKMFVIQ